MAWNPETYDRFKEERYAPFYDLSALVNKKPGMDVVDLGCGTGELTRKLADMLPDARVLGIDSSPEMLERAAAFAGTRVRFECRSIEEQTGSGQKWDLVFSNAALQWVDRHETLFPALISDLRPGGQLLVQMPAQHHNLTNRLLEALAGEEPFAGAIRQVRISPLLEIDAYARLFFEHGSRTVTAYEKIYPLVVKDTEALFTWVSGTALIPYLEQLQGEIRDLFIARYRDKLRENFNGPPVFYPFKRIILEATF